MNSQELGQKLVDLYNNGEHNAIYSELYSPNIRSIEADGMVSEGMEGVAAKGEWWEANFETHSTSARGPYPHGDTTFAVIFEHDTTHRESGARSQMDEIGVYEIKDGRIVEERFMYARMGE